MEDKIILQVKNLNKEFNIGKKNTLKAVNDISFDLRTSHTLGELEKVGLASPLSQGASWDSIQMLQERLFTMEKIF